MPNRNDTTNCVIGEGSIFDGRFYVNGSILIEGKFQGDIRTDDQLIVGPTGKVKTDIQARRVTIAGTLIGNITASEEVSLLHTGKVLGNIIDPKLSVEQGVITEGKVTITSGQSRRSTQDHRGILRHGNGRGILRNHQGEEEGKSEGQGERRIRKIGEP